jgi:methyl-accepting chemotaxis protein
MIQARNVSRSRFPGALTTRVSIILVLATILPLLTTVIVTQIFARPVLTEQVNTTMNADAQSRIQLIEDFLKQPLADIQTRSKYLEFQQYLSGNTNMQGAVFDILNNGFLSNGNYNNWSLFDTTGKLRDDAPKVPQQQTARQQMPGQQLTQILTARVPGIVISLVYHDPISNQSLIDINSPVLDATSKVLGVISATLNITYIQTIVNRDIGANGPNSYAFILDQNGVRIIDTDLQRRFTSIAPLDPGLQQTVQNQHLYGTNQQITLLEDQKLAAVQKSPQSEPTFQTVPASQNESFQVTRQTFNLVPWTYFVLSPMNTVTAVANQQIVIIALVATLVLFISAFIGLNIGQRITAPIMKSARSLQTSSSFLNSLAELQQNTAAEQLMRVDTARIGLDSVRYYANAIGVASERLTISVRYMLQGLQHHEGEKVSQAAMEISQVAQYIHDSTEYQKKSNQKLAAAIRVTSHITDQLAEGAVSTTEAADQLEEVVRQLRHIVGHEERRKEELPVETLPAPMMAMSMEGWKSR